MNKRLTGPTTERTAARIAALIAAVVINVSFAAAILYGGQSDMYRILVVDQQQAGAERRA